MRVSTAIVTGIVAVSLAGCGDTSKLPEQASHGPSPTIPEPVTSWLPTLNVAKAVGWPQGVKPKPAAGMNVNAFASGFDHPRWVYVLPNGDVLVAESNAPPKEEGGSGPRAWAQQVVMWWAGAKPKSADRISLVRDKDGDGVGETKTIFLKGLMSPFGMALIGDNLYVANADAIVRFKYTEGATEITTPAEKVTDLPGGPINHHWTKNILPSKDGKKLFATVGSNSNVAENGMEAETMRAAILEVDLANGNKRVFGAGLRNPNGMGLEPTTDELWTVVNERDELGSDLVPDYLTSVKDGGFYGWPYSYWGQHADTRVKPPNPEMVAKAIKPDYALGNHVAPLGMTFAQTSEGNTVKLPQQFASGVFVGEHGSWNRKPLSGYKVVFVPFANGKPSADLPLDVLTGFVSEDGKALGRPVGVTVAKDGALLVADDVGNVIWRVTAGAQTSAK